jgi:uncharacterized protein YrrD
VIIGDILLYFNKLTKLGAIYKRNCIDPRKVIGLPVTEGGDYLGKIIGRVEDCIIDKDCLKVVVYIEDKDFYADLKNKVLRPVFQINEQEIQRDGTVLIKDVTVIQVNAISEKFDIYNKKEVEDDQEGKEKNKKKDID